jgi:hypothetical protein
MDVGVKPVWWAKEDGAMAGRLTVNSSKLSDSIPALSGLTSLSKYWNFG